MEFELEQRVRRAAAELSAALDIAIVYTTNPDQHREINKLRYDVKEIENRVKSTM